MNKNKRVAKIITDPETKKMILETKEEDMTLSFFMELFGEFDGKRRCNPYDLIVVPKGVYGPEDNKNTNQFTTTVGLFIFNRYFIEKDLFNLFEYVNETVNDKKFYKILDKISQYYVEDLIDIDAYRTFLKKTQKTMPYVSILSPSFTENFLTSSEKITIKKNQLLKKYSKEIEEGDLVVADKIQKELMDYAKNEVLKDDPSMDIYDSGARGSFENNYKNIFIMKGATKDYAVDAKKEYNILTSNLIDGVSEKEYAYFANAMVAGPYSRGKKTEKGGYWEKLFLSAYQHITLDKPGSDCGTKRTLELKLTEDNVDFHMYSYIVEGSRLIELTSQNKDKYIGKTIRIRFSSLCEGKHTYCSKCAGNLFYRLNVMNVGAATPAIPAKLKLISMKAFHDSQVKLQEIDPMEVFSLT